MELNPRNRIPERGLRPRGGGEKFEKGKPPSINFEVGRRLPLSTDDRVVVEEVEVIDISPDDTEV